MLSLLEPIPGEDEIGAVRVGLGDENPLLRIAAMRALRQFPAEFRLQFDGALLDDPVRGVRLESALVYADIFDLLPAIASRSFMRAAEIEPTNNRYVYVLGVALNSLGQPDEAIALLQKARADFPDNFDIAWALATMLRDSGDLPGARLVIDGMAKQFPNNDNIEALRRALSR